MALDLMRRKKSVSAECRILSVFGGTECQEHEPLKQTGDQEGFRHAYAE